MKKKNEPKNDLRAEWKQSIASLFDELLEQIDDNAEEMDLTQGAFLKLKKLIDLQKDGSEEIINEFEITTEMVFDKGNDDLFESCLEEMDRFDAKPSETAIELMISIIDSRKAGYWIPSTSLAEDMKIEAFMDELSENPYQLKLIA